MVFCCSSTLVSMVRSIATASFFCVSMALVSFVTLDMFLLGLGLVLAVAGNLAWRKRAATA